MTQNIAIALTWLRVVAEAADESIGHDLVQEMQPTGYFEYVLELLEDFTPHHRRVYETIDLLDHADISPLQTGTIYRAYHDRCEVAGVTPLSERRIGDFLTHLELLNLIEVTYHYGGPHGKTREIQRVDWADHPDKDQG